MAASRTSAIAILGGSFDPVHNGHLAIAQAACEHFCCDKVLFVPAKIQPHKSDTVCAPAYHRLAMLRAAVSQNPRFAVWDGEMRREGPSFTIDTLTALHKKYPRRELLFLIGSDNLREIATWYCYKSILRAATLCVVHRPGHSRRVPPELAGGRIRWIPSPECPVSSTGIRMLLCQGYSCRYLTPQVVCKYIRRNGLYKKCV